MHAIAETPSSWGWMWSWTRLHTEANELTSWTHLHADVNELTCIHTLICMQKWTRLHTVANTFELYLASEQYFKWWSMSCINSPCSWSVEWRAKESEKVVEVCWMSSNLLNSCKAVATATKTSCDVDQMSKSARISFAFRLWGQHVYNYCVQRRENLGTRLKWTMKLT